VNRRSLVVKGGALLTVSLSGCIGSPKSDEAGGDATEITATEQNRDGESTTTSTSEGSTEIRIESSVEEELHIELRVSREESTVHTETIDVPSSQSVFADYEITETGVYDIAIKTDSGREGSTQVSVDDYALNHGRNIVIAITSQMIQGYIQE